MNVKIITFGELQNGVKSSLVYRGVLLDAYSSELGIYAITGYNTSDASEWVLHQPDFYTTGRGYVEVVYQSWVPPGVFIPIIRFQRALLKHKEVGLDPSERIEFQRNSGILRRFLDKETPWRLRQIYDHLELDQKLGWLF